MYSFRTPACAGTFYEDQPAALRAQIRGCFAKTSESSAKEATPVIGTPLAIISPHAGYRYSGAVAARAYGLLRHARPELVVVIGPNHRLQGAPVAIPEVNQWLSPLGPIAIDRVAAARLADACPLVTADDGTHLLEHSVEVQVPFLQYVLGNGVPLLPIVMSVQDIDTSRVLGLALAALLKGRKVIIVATSDFTHYETSASASRKDRIALDAIEALDADALLKIVEANRMSVCGYGPIAATILASGNLGATRARLLGYANSGDVTGDYDQVVAYAALAIDK